MFLVNDKGNLNVVMCDGRLYNLYINSLIFVINYVAKKVICPVKFNLNYSLWL